MALGYLLAKRGETDVLAAAGLPPAVDVAQIDFIPDPAGLATLLPDHAAIPDRVLGPVRLPTYTLSSTTHERLARRIVGALRHCKRVPAPVLLADVSAIVVTDKGGRRAVIPLYAGEIVGGEGTYLHSGAYRNDKLGRVLAEVVERRIGFSIREWP